MEEEWERNWKEESQKEVPIGDGVIEPGSLAFGSLTGFERLRRLETALFTLTGPVPRVHLNEGAVAVAQCRLELEVRLVESLPESLGELALWNCTGVNRGAVNLLFDRRWRGELRKLNMVELVFLETVDGNDLLYWQTEGKRLELVVTARMREEVSWTDGPVRGGMG